MDRDRRSTAGNDEASLGGGSNDVFEVFQQAIAQVAEERRRARSQPTPSATEEEDDLSSLEGPVLDLTSATSSSSSLSSHRQQESSSSNNLSSSTQAKLMQSLAALLQHTQQQQQAEDSPSASAALRLNSTKPKNGDRTPNKGPCPCGYRHWLDGQEYDHVFLLETDNGPTFLGFNHEDNPYAVATAFVARNNLNRGSINDTHLISTLANRIIEVTSTRSSSSSASSPSLSSLSNDASSLSASDTSPFNTSSSSLSSLPPSSLSPEEEEEKRRRDHEARQQQYLEETKRRQAEEKERKREKERIRQQIKQARIDKEARQREEKRLEEELRKQRLESGDSSSSSSSSSTFSSSPTSFSVAAEENQKENNRKEKWEDPMVTAYDEDDDDDDEFYGRSEYRSRKDADLLVDDPAFQQLLTQARATSKKQPTNSRLVTLNDIQSTNQAIMDDVVPTPTTQKEWDLRMLSYKYGKLGEVGLVAALDKVGFKPTEIKGMLSLARILHTTSASSQQGRNAFSALASTRNSDLAPSSSLSPPSMNNPSSSWFVGRGQTLGSEPEEEKKNNKQKNETETAVVTMAKQIVVDESQPQTSVMVRLHTGARLVIKCNHSHTVADLRSHIETEVDLGGRNYDLMTTFPRAKLSNVAQTVKEASLLNASIIQSLST